MRFLHLSDPHLRRDYQSDWFTRDMFSFYDNPTTRFEQLLQRLRPEDYDFALITGDLTHEGEAEDYQLLRDIWQREMGDLPFFFCRGNHDPRQAFFTGMSLQENPQLEYASCHSINGLRVIALDSAQDDSHEGKISEAQLQQLKDWLKEPSPAGTILLLHHPLIWEEEEICSQTPPGFAEVIASSDIKAIFVGHIHRASAASYHGKMQYMAEALSFGVDEYPDQSIFTNRTGYSEVSLADDQIFVYRHYLTPGQTMIGQLEKPIDNNRF